MLTPREAFKVGFLYRCASDGLSAAATAARVKAAAGLLDAAGSVLGNVLPLAVAGPPLAGAVAGYSAARLSDVDDADVNEFKANELLAEYRRHTEQLRRRRAVRDYLAARRRTGRVF